MAKATTKLKDQIQNKLGLKQQIMNGDQMYGFLKDQIQNKLGLKLSAMPEEFELEIILKDQIQNKLGLKHPLEEISKQTGKSLKIKSKTN